MDPLPFSVSFSSCSELISLLLVSVTVLTNGVDPEYPLWGKPWYHTFLQFLTMASLVFFTVFRFFLEAISAATAPREFLVISFVYFARWIYFFCTQRSSSAFSGRLSKVARSLRMLVTLRVGTSTHLNRLGAQEIVIRSGARKAKGEAYWRGKIRHQESVGRGWLVYLVEEQMHTDLLSDLGTMEYTRIQRANIDDLYRRVYTMIMNVEGADNPRVDWTKFLSEYSPISKTNLAFRAGATSDGDLAGVARRVAADACLYVAGKRGYRTDAQIALINACVEDAAKELAKQLSEETDGDDREGQVSAIHKEPNSNTAKEDH